MNYAAMQDAIFWIVVFLVVIVAIVGIVYICLTPAPDSECTARQGAYAVIAPNTQEKKMKFLSNSICALCLGGVLGVLFWAFLNGISVTGVPIYLIAGSSGVLAWAWDSVWFKKSESDWTRMASLLYISVVIGFPLLGAFMDGGTGPIEGQLVDRRLLMPFLKWGMIAGLVLSTLFSLMSIWSTQGKGSEH
ncbi:MAG: hypothetical protein ACTJG9_00325 [Alcaligenes aquatilis]